MLKIRRLFCNHKNSLYDKVYAVDKYSESKHGLDVSNYVEIRVYKIFMCDKCFKVTKKLVQEKVFVNNDSNFNKYIEEIEALGYINFLGSKVDL